MGGLESNVNVTTDWHQIAYQSLRIDWADVANSAHPRPVFAAIICVVVVCVCIYFAVAPSPVRLTHAANTVLVRRHSRTSSKVATNVPLSSLVRSACPSLAHGRFFPTPWLVSGHLQTLYAGLVSKFPELRANYDRELFDLPDGGLIAIDWNKNHKDMPATSPILILLHGLAGGSRETYICDLVPYALRDNYRVAALNFRGCGNTEITTPQLYSAAHTADLRALINHIHQSYPLAPLVGIGFSLGANILLKYVGEESTKCPLIACVSVANPYDLNLGINGLHSSFIGKQLYSKVMTQSLIGIYKRHRNMFEKNPQHPQFSDPLSPNQILNAKYLPDFDEAATRRVFGYRTVSEYYRMGSSAQYIPDLAIPTLMLSDLDDPIALSSSIPLADALGNPYVILATTRNGGHLGWFEGIFFPKRWFPTPVMEFVNALVESHDSLPPHQKHMFVESRVQKKQHVHYGGRHPVLFHHHSHQNHSTHNTSSTSTTSTTSTSKVTVGTNTTTIAATASVATASAAVVKGGSRSASPTRKGPKPVSIHSRLTMAIQFIQHFMGGNSAETVIARRFLGFLVGACAFLVARKRWQKKLVK